MGGGGPANIGRAFNLDAEPAELAWSSQGVSEDGCVSEDAGCRLAGNAS